MTAPTASRLAHALERLREHWLPDAELEDALAAEAAIRGGQALRLRSESSARALYLVRLREGLAVLALYDEAYRCVITFYPEEARLASRGLRRARKRKRPAPPARGRCERRRRG